MAILQSVSKWQCVKVDFSGKNANFWTLIGCHGNVPEKSKKLNEMYKALHPSTNPEILVKIGPLASTIQVLESRPLKK